MNRGGALRRCVRVRCLPERSAARGRTCLAACAALGALAVGLAAAQSPGADTPAGQDRWVNGSNVNLRSAPALSGEVLARLPRNAQVSLLAAQPGAPGAASSGYCHVAWWPTPGGQGFTGYTACRYLGAAPVPAPTWQQAELPDGSPNMAFDPVRAFWLAPSWAGLEAYARRLEALRLPEYNGAVSAEERRAAARPPDAELERMKAHLALGIYGPRPQPLLSWEALQEKARAVAANPADYLLGLALIDSLGLHGVSYSAADDTALENAQAAGLVRALALPSASPSLFKTQRDVAALHEGAAVLSGRFDIIHTYQTRARRAAPDDPFDSGLWNIGQVSVALVRPVARITLFRDGRVRAAASQARRTQQLWSGPETPWCEGFVAGFAQGDSDPRIWRDFGVADYDLKRLPNPSGSLVSFHTRLPVALTSARLVSQPLRLDRARTGFVSATQWHFDLDGDGVPDLVAIEGVGHGPGHLDGPTKTDDAWYRLFFANIAGRWFVLGHDTFAYGCGC